MKLRVVPARTGMLWVRLGMKAFFKQPLALAGLFFLFMACVSVLSIVPVLGNIMALALLPAATLGLMEASRMAAEGKFPMPRVLASALTAGKSTRQAMLVLGGWYAVAFLGVMAVSALVDGGDFARLYLVGGSLSQEALLDSDFQMATWVALGLYLPVSLMFWHAPALVFWYGIAPVKSLFFSFMACKRNFGALTVFGLTWLGTFVLVGLAITLIGSLLGSPELAGAAMFPVAMVMASMFFSSIYFTFRDSFELPPEPTA